MDALLRDLKKLSGVGTDEPIVEFTKDSDKAAAAKDVKKAVRLASALYSHVYLAFNTLRNSRQLPETATKLKDCASKLQTVETKLKEVQTELK
jgi:hypothetical protein